MSYAPAIHTRLAADATLTGLLTGGVFLFTNLPENVNPTTLPAVYDGALLKPFAVVKGRGNNPTPFIRDSNTQFTSTRQVVEIYLYSDPDGNYDTITTAANRIYALLHERPVAGAYQITLNNEIDGEREDSLLDANMLRRDYEVVGRRDT